MRQQGLLAVHRQNRSEIDVELDHALQTYRALKSPKAPTAVPVQSDT